MLPRVKQRAMALGQRWRHRLDRTEVLATSLAAGKKERILSSRSSSRLLIKSADVAFVMISRMFDDSSIDQSDIYV